MARLVNWQLNTHKNRGSVDGMAHTHVLHGAEYESRQRQDIFVFLIVQTDPGDHTASNSMVSVISREVKRPGPVDDQPTSKAKAKNEWSYTYNHPYTFDVQRNKCMCCKLPLELVHNQDTQSWNNTNKIIFILIYFNKLIN
jgi:hypothetical protein